MTNEKKPSEVRSKKQEPAKHHTDAIMAKFLPPGVGPSSAEEWRVRDMAILERREAEERRARSLALRDRGKLLTACGAPEAHVELITSGKVDKTSDVMDEIDDWSQGVSRICVLSGPVGVGKTVAAIRWLANFGGPRPCFVRAGDFEARGRYSHVFRDAWQEATGMVLDDLGCEYKDVKGNLLADLDTLIDTFSVGGGRLIVTTNLPWAAEGDDFQKRYEERIASRIVGSADWINVHGPDLRRVQP